MSKTKTETNDKIFCLHQERTQEREVYLRVDKKVKSRDIIDYFEKINSNEVLDKLLPEWDNMDAELDWGNHEYSNCNIREKDSMVPVLHPYTNVYNISLKKNGSFDVVDEGLRYNFSNLPRKCK